MLSELYTPKQLDTFRFAVNNDYFMLINHGAKRTGKTVLDNDLFLYELRRIKKIAVAQGVENPQYILAGADLGALNRNVLIELSNKYGIEFHFDKFNRFKLFGRPHRRGKTAFFNLFVFCMIFKIFNRFSVLRI